jgi:hypothetical protein
MFSILQKRASEKRSLFQAIFESLEDWQIVTTAWSFVMQTSG